MKKKITLELEVEDNETELIEKKLKQDLKDAIYTACSHTFEVKDIVINDLIH